MKLLTVVCDATDGKDQDELQLENVGQFNLMGETFLVYLFMKHDSSDQV